MSEHLGSRVSLLLDGQLVDAEAETAWRHVHVCGECQDLVAYEGWLKARLAGCAEVAPRPDVSFVGALAQAPARTGFFGPRAKGLTLLGGGALGAVVAGFVVLGAGTVTRDLQPPTGSVVTPANDPSATPASHASATPAVVVFGTHRVSAGVPGVKMVP